MSSEQGTLQDKVTIVTGAGSGIGRASAIRFAAAGASVVVADLRGHKAQATVDEITAVGGAAVTSETDVGDGDQVAAMIELAVEGFGGLDVVFSNAGTSVPGTAAELSTEQWDRVWKVNVSSLFHCAKYAIPHLKERRGGSIIATASISGMYADAGNAAYAASKAGVTGLVRALAVDHARDGVRANAICPGITATPPMLYALADESLRERAEDAVAIGRLADPDELAEVALFLAGDGSSYVSGQTIVVDGGLTAESAFSRISRMQ